MKKLLKKKFVTGQSKDKVLMNLLNMSDSDEEGRDQTSLLLRRAFQL